ncbi:MAG: radical SAM protein [Candidatus Bipolaricaulota bacterium]|nr:radical SAM protein [Candidatus Bipolaricaulota bacterium]
MGSSETSIAFEASLFDVLRTGLRITHGSPRLTARTVRLLWRQKRAAGRRDRAEARGVHVPPFVIYSVTGRCNLQCAGCYANLLHRQDGPELTPERTAELLVEAKDLGVSVMLLAGGEPLLRQDLLDQIQRRPEILFLLFSNGSLLDEARMERLRRMPHVVPVLSLEGGEAETDERRGDGTYEHVTAAMDRLAAGGTFFGTSATLTCRNFNRATDEAHLRRLIARGCRLFYFINYVPVAPGTDDLQLEEAQVAELERRLALYRRTLGALFIAFPHDEMALGGCLAAGRGFVHINAYGAVEPCPFSPYSDSDLTVMSLEQALGSELFRTIRDSGKLDEADGRCALWKKREWVKGLVDGENRPESLGS